MIKARPLSCSVIDCFGLGAASLIALLNTDWTAASKLPTAARKLHLSDVVSQIDAFQQI